MLLVLGDSFAHWASHRCVLPASVVTAGRRGGRLDDEAFRQWAIGVVFRSRPERVLLIVGGNDLAGPVFNARHLHQMYEELISGVLAAGAGQVTVLPIPPRTACRPGGATVSAYRRRRRLMNLLLRRSFRRPRAASPVAFCPFTPGPGFVGRDGVHPSAEGWRELAAVILFVASAPPIA